MEDKTNNEDPTTPSEPEQKAEGEAPAADPPPADSSAGDGAAEEASPQVETESDKPAEAQSNEEAWAKAAEQSAEITGEKKTPSEYEQEVAIAEARGWHRLGRFFLEVTRSLPDEEIASIAKAQAKVLMQIEELELEKKEFNAEIKRRIDTLQGAAIESAKKISKGEHVDNCHLPAFLDPATKERVWFDPKKNEEVKREPAKKEDLQGKLGFDDGPAGKPSHLSVVEGGVSEEKPPADILPFKKPDDEEAAAEEESPDVEPVAEIPAPEDPEKVACQNCDGTGHVENQEEGTVEPCFRCNGSGKVFDSKVSVNLDPLSAIEPIAAGRITGESQPEAPAE